MTAQPVLARGQVRSLPARAAAEHAQLFLRRVDERLTVAVDDLSELWAELADPAPVDVLADRDLPELLRSLADDGKRIRPTMCFWGFVASGGERPDRLLPQLGSVSRPMGVPTGSDHLERVLQVSVALELLHVFALIHDDVMDESESRRGRPSVHTLATQLHLHARARGSAQRFGESIAVLVGDLAHAEADHLVAELPTTMRRIWRRLVVELVHGQSRDLTGTAAARRDLEHARQVAQMKSGAYTVQRPLELGLAAAEAEPDVAAMISGYGRQVGEAFALRDDVLGVWGDPQQTGKPAGDDLLSGKPTVIMALADDRLTGAARQTLRRVGTPDLSPADVAHLQDALTSHGIAQAVEARIAGHVEAAVSSLDPAVIDPLGRAGLTEMAHQIAWRNR